MFEDFDLIVSSFRAQYGVKIYSKEFQEMRWDEFRALLSGLGSNTPLARIVQIRSENNEEVLKHFTKDQHRIRNEWRRRSAKKVSEKKMTEFLDQMKQALISMAGGGNN